MNSKKRLPKLPNWLKINNGGSLIITWKEYKVFHPFDNIETALRQIVHILEKYGDERITIDDTTILIPGKISKLKKFRDIVEKTIKFLKSNALDFKVGEKIQNQIEISEEEIISNVDKEIEKDIKIYLAVMKRGLIIKKEIIRSKKILRIICKGLVYSYKSLAEYPTKSNIQYTKNKISGKGINLTNGFDTIIVNPYKERINFPEIKRLRNIFNVNSAEELQRIIKNAINRLLPAISDQVKSEIFLTK